MDFILASQSKFRLQLLEKIYCVPKKIVPADIDESPLKKEKPEDYVKRIAKSKAMKVAENYKNENILAADSIVALNRQIIQKPHDVEETKTFLKKYSNKNIRALTGVCFIKKDGALILKLVETKIKFKSLNDRDINDSIKYSKNLSCAGGISIENFSECLIKKINGSYSNIVGLPLYEVRNILISCGVL